MAGHTIPDQMFPTVMPTGAPMRDFETINASPAAFGAAKDAAIGDVGQGLEHVATAGIDLAEQQARMDAHTHAAELHSWQAQQVTNEQEQFLQLRGRAAKMALPDFQKKIEDIQGQALGQAENPFTRQLVSDASRRLSDYAYSMAARHAASENATWEKQTANDASATYGNQAVLAATQSPVPAISDDLNVQRFLSNSDNERRNVASQNGYEGPALTQQIAQNRGRNVKAIVEQIAGEDNPQGLKRAFDFYQSQKDKIDAASRIQIQNYLRGPLAKVAGSNAADRYMGRPTEFQPMLDSIGERYGVSGTYLARTWQIESGGRLNPPASSTGAQGPFQFTGGTARQYGLANPNDFRQSAEAAARLAADNKRDLTNSLDRVPSDAELYLAHQQGADGAAKLLLNPNTRAGDLVGDKAIRVNGGDPNAPASAFTSMWTARFNTNAPLRPKGDVLVDILNDPDLTNRPNVQAAALARVNHFYEAYHTEQTQQSVVFKQRLRDSLSEMGMTGTVKSPLPQEDFISALGYEKGAAAYVEYQKQQKFYASMAATANNSPDQNDALLKQYEPKAGEENYAERANEYGQLAQAIQKNQEKLQKAPADYTMSISPSVQAARQTLNNALSDPKAPLELRQAAARTFADTQLAEQERLGVPPEQRQIVSKAYVDSLVAKLQRPDTVGGGAAVGALIHSEAMLWGEHWPDVYRQVAKSASAPFRVLGSGVAPAAEKALVDNFAVSDKDLLKNETDPETKIATITSAVQSEMEPFKKTLVGSDRDPTLRDFSNAATKLAIIYTGQGDGAAAEHAVRDLVGFKYDFASTYRVPKYVIGPKGEMAPAPFTPAQIAAGVSAARANLGQDSFSFNQQYVKPGAHDYNTKLAPEQETAFRTWVQDNRVPFDVNARVSDYDMRGFWKALQAHDPRAMSAVDPNDKQLHYPDYWKTPYHETFSRESQWATADAPEWNDKDQLVDKSGRVIFDDRNRAANLPRLAIASPPDRGEGYTPEYRMQAKLSALRRTGVWVTDPYEKGLMLTYDSQAVRGADGQPVTLSWEQLVGMGQKQAKDDAARALQLRSYQP